MELLREFKLAPQLAVQMVFDESSRFLACGTTDSHIKVFDIKQGFQTHNFIHPRGVITRLAFIPGGKMRLVATAEDFIIRVWDLMLKKEIAQMKPKVGEVPHATTSFSFTKDHKIMITAGRDGYIHFWNSNYGLINNVSAESLGALKDDEITSMMYLQSGPSLMFGMSSG